MSWKTVRLELAKTSDHPNGSPVRAYLMRLPLDRNGAISPLDYERDPNRATVRRFWPNEPDRAGTLDHGPLGWSLVFRQGPSAQEIYHMQTLKIALDQHVVIAAPDGQWLPFRVARCD